jgi:glucose/arabinose dehydrogenase
MKTARAALLCIAVPFAAACGRSPSDPPEPPPLGELELRLVEVATGLASPVHLSAPAGDSRLYIVEQHGRIRVVQNGQLLPTPFLDISTIVRSGGEAGLLSVAFHPNYASNGYLFVNYTDANGDTRVVRYTASTDRTRAEPASAHLILHVAQPWGNHNGGQLAFGPDGMLYIGMGDGGSATGGDAHGHGQNTATLHGALLRIDINGGNPYRIPPNNPFATSTSARPEIWAIGLRNPWRFSFDHERGLIYIADVGEGRREEVNVQPASAAGLNYGWNRMEGTLCFPATGSCNQTGLTLPALEYENQVDGCSVTGGFAYRGSTMPELRGHYFYADFCRGWVRSFRYTQAGQVADQRNWDFGNPGRISSFGEDGAGELYVVIHQGRVYRISRAQG